MNKKNYILNNADTRYFEYFFLRRLRYGKSIVVHVDEEGTDYSVTIPKDASFDAIKLKGNTVQTGTPTPETPATIKTVSGEQTIKINKTNYGVNLGKNLLEVTASSTSANNLTFTVNTDKSITINGTASADTNFFLNNSISLSKEQYTISGCPAGGSSSKYYIAVRGDGNWNNQDTGNALTITKAISGCAITIKSGTKLDNLVFKPQIEKGSTATSYAQYFEPIELCKISNFQDYIYKDGDDWYVHKEFGKVDLSTLSWNETKYNNCYIRRNTVIPNIKYVPNNRTLGVALAEKYILRIGSGGSGDDAINHIMVDVDAVAVNTGTVSNIPVTGLFYYQLATPTNTKITDTTLISQLNALFASGLKSGVNTIKVTAPSGLLPTIFNIIINH